MHRLGVLATLTLIGMTACAERLVSPALIPKPASAPEAELKPRQNKVGVRRQVQKITEDTSKHLAIRPQPAAPSAGVKPQQQPATQSSLPQASQQPQATPGGRDAVAAPPPPSEPAEPNLSVAAVMPPPPEPAEPTFPSDAPAIELPSPPKPAAPTQPEAPLEEAAIPPPPEAVEPTFPITALLPPPEPAEPSLPSQEEVTAESPTLIPFPELSSPLSMRPRFDWVDTVGAIEVPRRPLSEIPELSPERQIPSLIRNPWPLSEDAS
jgi:hypothetical protein